MTEEKKKIIIPLTVKTAKLIIWYLIESALTGLVLTIGWKLIEYMNFLMG